MEQIIDLPTDSAKPGVFCYSRYDGAAPFANHLSGLNEMLEGKFRLTTLDEADYFLALDHEPKIFEKVAKRGIPVARRFLIVREPRQVHPYSHSKAARNSYSKVFLMGAASSQGVSNYWPYDVPRNFVIKEPSAPRRNRVVAVAGWRISFIRGSLYGLRARAYSEESVDLFGRDWDADWSKKIKEITANALVALKYPCLAALALQQLTIRPANYKGSTPNKFDILAQYKVSLVIENSLEYFSEKLFDSLVSGTIPVYCGPNPSLLGLPKGLVIWCEPKIESIQAGIAIAQETDYLEWRKNLDDWLATFDNRSPLRAEQVWRHVIETLGSRIDQDGTENE